MCLVNRNMGSKVKLDDVDRRILRDLQADGRMTNVELAKRIGISAPPCLRRVRALEENKIIRGYHADINMKLFGNKLAQIETINHIIAWFFNHG